MKSVTTAEFRIYISGPIDMAKQILREYAMINPICVTIEPTTYVYTGGEEEGYVVGVRHYPRFPLQSPQFELLTIARNIAKELVLRTWQNKVMIVGPSQTEWWDRSDFSGYRGELRG